MQATPTDVERRTVAGSAAAVPPRPEWLPQPRSTVPPRPDWLLKQPPNPFPRGVVIPHTESPTNILVPRRSRHWGRDATSFLVSLTVHLCLLLLLWQVFQVVTRAQPLGYVISLEIDDGEGAESEHLAIIETPLPNVAEHSTLDAAAIVATQAPGGEVAPAVDVGSGGGGAGVGFFGSRAAANSVVFVVDKSGSMSHGTRLITAKQELKNALLALRPHQRFYVIFYDDDMHRMLGIHAPDHLLPATPRHVRAVLKWIHSDVSPGGGTEPRESLITALAMAPEAIFFLTDGDVKSDVPPAVLDANPHQTAIHTLCFSNEFGEEAMRLIAQENRGRYRYVDSPGEENSRQPQQDESAAIAKLRNARKYLTNGQEATAQRWLRKVIDDHPGSPPAQQAQQLLDSLSAAP